jgi:hypothetical protein
VNEMTETKFTPGPWIVQDPLGPDQLSIVAGDDPATWADIAQIGVEPCDEHSPTKEQAHANALLIAASPDLYAALDDIVKLAAQLGAIDLELHDALAALAKARGETP